MKVRILLAAIITLTTIHSSLSQENITTVGFHYKPIIPNEFFGTGPKNLTQNNIDFRIALKSGYCAGMIIRRGFKKGLSLEGGINYVKRNFDLRITDTTFIDESDFTIIGYQIPVNGIIFLQMAKNIFMCTSLGLSMDMYASNIRTYNDYFKHTSKRNGIFQFASVAGLGWEFRTEKSGFFYVGANYHLPFSTFYTSSVNYLPYQEVGRIKLSGNYFAVDLRYYFHEDPEKPKKKKKK